MKLIGDVVLILKLFTVFLWFEDQCFMSNPNFAEHGKNISVYAQLAFTI